MTSTISSVSNTPSPVKSRVNDPYKFGKQLQQQKKEAQQLGIAEEDLHPALLHRDSFPTSESASQIGSDDAQHVAQQQQQQQHSAALYDQEDHSFYQGYHNYNGGSSSMMESYHQDEHSYTMPPPPPPPPSSLLPMPQQQQPQQQLGAAPPPPPHVLLGSLGPSSVTGGLARGLPQRNKAVICRRYLETGACQYGGVCPYRHLCNGTEHEEPVPRSICKFHLNQGACLRDSCPFFHGPEQLLRQLQSSGRPTYRPAQACEVRDPEEDKFNMDSSNSSSSSHSAAFLGPMPPQGSQQQQQQMRAQAPLFM